MPEQRSGGRRRRRRTRHHPVRRRRRRIGYGFLVALAVVGVLGAVLARDAVRTRHALVEARDQLDGARAALGAGEIDQAEQLLASARDEIGRAQTLTGRLLWRAGSSVPVLGRSLRNVSGVVDVAGAASRLGQQVVDRAGGFLGQGGQLQIEVSDGKVALEPLEVAAEAVGRLDLASLRNAAAELGDETTYLVPGEVVDGRRDALELAQELIGAVERAQTMLDVLPGFLGRDGPRRYFLAMQNNAELRGTGGLIGEFSVLTVNDGSFSLSEPQSYGVLDQAPAEPEERLDPVPTSEEFRRRYRQVNAAGFFANVNVDPDLPTTGPVLTALYEKNSGESIDGVIALDPVGLSTILRAVGPVRVPESVHRAGLPNPVPPRDVPQVTMVDVYEAFDDDHAARKDYIVAFATAAFGSVFEGDWDGVEMVRRIGAAASARHLQLYSEDEDEQSAFVDLGIGGSMGSSSQQDDLLAVTGINAAANKMDVHVGHTLTGEVSFEREHAGWIRRATVGVGLDNPLPDSGMPQYVIGSSPTDARELGRAQTGPLGLNRTWFTLWAPASTDVVAARDAEGRDLLVGVDEIHGHQAVDHFLETPSESSSRFEVDLSGPVELRSDGRDSTYRLRLWRQAKAIPDRVDLTIHAPDGMRVADVIVSGGGDGAGMGPYGEPGPDVSAETVDGAVHVTGDVNADLDIEVRFSPPPRSLWQRVRDWLGEPAF